MSDTYAMRPRGADATDREQLAYTRARLARCIQHAAGAAGATASSGAAGDTIATIMAVYTRLQCRHVVGQGLSGPAARCWHEDEAQRLSDEIQALWRAESTESAITTNGSPIF